MPMTRESTLLRRFMAGLLTVVLCGLAVGARAQGSVESDRAALMALYNATGGPNWSDNTNWGTKAPLGEWLGVIIDVDGRVVGLTLIGNGLVGELPAELGDLTSLAHLSFASNSLTGPLPAEFGSLVSLKELALELNSFTGPLSILGELVNLERASLFGNSFTGPIPAALGDLANIEVLVLSQNRLTGPIPAALGNLANLTNLVLADNFLTGPIPAALGNLANLELLIFSNSDGTPPGLGNALTGQVPSSFGNLQNLRFLWIQGNRLEGALPSSLTNLSLEGMFGYSAGEPTLRFDSNAGLCAPADDAFQAWLESLPFGYTGDVCGTAVPAVPAVGLVLLALILAGGYARSRVPTPFV